MTRWLESLVWFVGGITLRELAGVVVGMGLMLLVVWVGW